MGKTVVLVLAAVTAGLTAAPAVSVPAATAPSASEPAPAAPARGEVPTIGVDEVVAGMKGYGESVFVGAGTERFEVEVLGVLREFAPGTSYILARLTGKNLERTGVVAGMSGSPVWLDGKLAGAVAFGWSFSQEAIAGITPISAMRGIERAAPWGRNAGTPKVALGDLLDRKLPQDLFAQLAAPLTAPLGRAAGIDSRGAISWGASGFSERALSTLGRALPMMAPAALGKTSTGAELAGGSSVAAVLLDGDLRLAATGTVTERSGDRILAFGHPLFGLGEVSMPMASAEIVTILGSNLSSFKLSNVGPVVGAFQRDHSAGNFGRIGVVARTIPLTISVASPEPRRFEMRMAAIPEFEGLLAAIASLGAVDTVTASGGAGAIDLALVADLGANGKLSMRQSFDGDGAAFQAVLFTLGLVDFVARNDLASVDIERLDIELVPHDEPRVDELLSAHALRPRLAPGESTELLVELRNWRGALERRRFEVTVPADTPDGRFVVLVGDGTRIDSARFALEPPAPRTFEQARKLIASLGSARELSLLAIAPGRSAVAGGEIHARLPPSLSAVLGAAGGGRAIRGAIAARETHAQARPLSGLVRVDLEVERSLPLRGEAGAAGSREKPERGGV
jgi:hypothetical protein